MRVRVARHVLAAPVSLLCMGCDMLFDNTCTLEAVPGIAVIVLDSTNSASIDFYARVVAQDGSYADTAFASMIRSGDPANPVPKPDWGAYYLAVERPGSYTVSVSLAGYRDWSRENVVVRDGECHVRTVEFQAALQRVPS